MEIIVTGIVGAVSVVLLCSRLGLRRMARWGWAIDILGTLGLAAMFAGTYAGAAAAMLGGAVLSLVMLVLRRIVRNIDRMRETSPAHR